MNTETENYFESSHGALMLWIGTLGAPTLWFVNQQINLVLVNWVCTSGAVWILHLVTGLCLAGGVATALLAWRNWRRLRHEAPDEETPRSRSHFMAAVGLMSSLFFGLVIIAQGIPSFVINPCQR